MHNVSIKYYNRTAAVESGNIKLSRDGKPHSSTPLAKAPRHVRRFLRDRRFRSAVLLDIADRDAFPSAYAIVPLYAKTDNSLRNVMLRTIAVWNRLYKPFARPERIQRVAMPEAATGYGVSISISGITVALYFDTAGSAKAKLGNSKAATTIPLDAASLVQYMALVLAGSPVKGCSSC